MLLWFNMDLRTISEAFRKFFVEKFLKGKIGQQYQAGAEGRKFVLIRLRAAAVGRIFSKNAPLNIFFTFSSVFVHFRGNFRISSIEEKMGRILGPVLRAENWSWPGLGQRQWAVFLKKGSSKVIFN